MKGDPLLPQAAEWEIAFGLPKLVPNPNAKEVTRES